MSPWLELLPVLVGTLSFPLLLTDSECLLWVMEMRCLVGYVSPGQPALLLRAPDF